MALVGALGVAVVAGSISRPASANEPTDLRVVSVTRSDDGVVTMVVSVPTQLLAAARSPGGLTVDSATGAPVAPTVAALPPAATAVAVLLHTVGADAFAMRRANGTAAELVRSLDPAVAVSLVSTTGLVLAALGTDRSATLAALGRPATDAPVAFPAALGAVGSQFVGRGYVDPLVVVIDAAPDDVAITLPTDALAPAGMGWRIIPIGVVPSPLVAQFAQRTGLAVPTGSDPVALVDEAVGLMQGRFSVRVVDPGGAALTVHVRGASGDLVAPVKVAVPVPAAAPTTAVATTAGATTAVATAAAPTTTEPVILAERSAPVVAPPVPASGGSSSWWKPVAGGAVAVAVLGGGALLVGRRRSAARAGEPELPDDGTPSAPVPGYRYTDLSQPLPSGAVKSRPRREIVARGPVAPDSGAAAGAAGASFERRRRVLALAEELGNVSEACRVVGVSRRSYYEWKRIADEQGIDALRLKHERMRGPEN
jgi:hypothetical protein